MATTLQNPKPITRKAVPDQGPFVSAILICPTCAQVVLPTFSRMNNGTIHDIVFYHVNEEYGCAWKNMDSKARALGPTEGLKRDVRAGNDGQGHPKFVDEHELAVGKSFDMEGLKPQPPSASEVQRKMLESLIGNAGSQAAEHGYVMGVDGPKSDPKELQFMPPTRLSTTAADKPSPLVEGNETANDESKTGTEGGDDAA